jgi:hypothetical protein
MRRTPENAGGGAGAEGMSEQLYRLGAELMRVTDEAHRLEKEVQTWRSAHDKAAERVGELLRERDKWKESHCASIDRLERALIRCGAQAMSEREDWPAHVRNCLELMRRNMHCEEPYCTCDVCADRRRLGDIEAHMETLLRERDEARAELERVRGLLSPALQCVRYQITKWPDEWTIELRDKITAELEP